MKQLIVTRSDAGFSKIAELTHPILQKYAKKCGADFLILDHETDCDEGDGIRHYRIMKCLDLYDEYDRILVLDSDLLIRVDCPNIFDMVPEECVGSIFEDKGSRLKDRRNRILDIQDQFGQIGWETGYINTGVFVTSKCHRNIFTKINGWYYTGEGCDDVHLGYQIHKAEFEIRELPYKFNHMSMFSESWNYFANKYDSYIIHYAGPQKGKFEIIKHDMERFNCI